MFCLLKFFLHSTTAPVIRKRMHFRSEMATPSRWKLSLSALRSFPRVNLTNLQPFPGTRKKVCKPLTYQRIADPLALPANPAQCGVTGAGSPLSYWTTRGYANSRTGHIADWSRRRCRRRRSLRAQAEASMPASFNHLTELDEHLWTEVLKHLNVHIYLVTIAYRYYNQLISRTDLSPIPVRSAANSYITSWCIQNLSKRVLNRQTVSTSTTKLQTIPDINYTCRKRILSCIVVKRMIE